MRVASQNPDDSKFIPGQQLTGFSNEEEAINKLTTAVPLLAKNALKAEGAAHHQTAADTKNQ